MNMNHIEENKEEEDEYYSEPCETIQEIETEEHQQQTEKAEKEIWGAFKKQYGRTRLWAAYGDATNVDIFRKDSDHLKTDESY